MRWNTEFGNRTSAGGKAIKKYYQKIKSKGVKLPTKIEAYNVCAYTEKKDESSRLSVQGNPNGSRLSIPPNERSRVSVADRSSLDDNGFDAPQSRSRDKPPINSNRDNLNVSRSVDQRPSQQNVSSANLNNSNPSQPRQSLKS